MSKNLSIAILAGGRGERMRLPDEGQKCIQKIDGLPLIVHVINSLTEAFPSALLIFALAHQAEKTWEIINHYLPYDTEAEATVDTGIGTTNAYYQTLKYSSLQLFVAGDVITTPNAFVELSQMVHELKRLCITTSFDDQGAKSHPVVYGENQVIKQFSQEDPQENPSDNYVGRYQSIVMTYKKTELPDLMRLFPYSSLPLVFGRAVKAGVEVCFHQSQEPWLHVAYQHDLQKTWQS